MKKTWDGLLPNQLASAQCVVVQNTGSAVLHLGHYAAAALSPRRGAVWRDTACTGPDVRGSHKARYASLMRQLSAKLNSAYEMYF